MSIYQVPINEWFCDKSSPFHRDLYVVEAALNAGTTCEKCGGVVTMQTGYCSHGIAYGFGEMYCCSKCAGYKEDKPNDINHFTEKECEK
jgi:hypothetical protein